MYDLRHERFLPVVGNRAPLKTYFAGLLDPLAPHVRESTPFFVILSLTGTGYVRSGYVFVATYYICVTCSQTSSSIMIPDWKLLWNPVNNGVDCHVCVGAWALHATRYMNRLKSNIQLIIVSCTTAATDRFLVHGYMGVRYLEKPVKKRPKNQLVSPVQCTAPKKYRLQNVMNSARQNVCQQKTESGAVRNRHSSTLGTLARKISSQCGVDVESSVDHPARTVVVEKCGGKKG